MVLHELLQVRDVLPVVEHPDFRQIAAFFLGWLFLYSIQLIVCSESFLNAFRRLFSICRSSPPVHHFLVLNIDDVHQEGYNSIPPGKTTQMDSHSIHHASIDVVQAEDRILVLMLAVCFASASIADFASLLRFSPGHGEVACAFVVAWGGMAAHAARLTGLLILGGQLRKLGVGCREMFGFWSMLVVILGLAFADNAIRVGTLSYVSPLGISWCYRRPYMPSGLASSLLLILLDVYVIARVATFTTPTFLRWNHRLQIISDSRLQRASSLLLFEAMNITSSAVRTNILVDFIPLSIGGIIVLAAFSFCMEESEVVQFPSTRGSSMRTAPAATMAPTPSMRSLHPPSHLSPALSSSPISIPKPAHGLQPPLDSGNGLGTFIHAMGRPIGGSQRSPSVAEIPPRPTTETTETTPEPYPRQILESQVQYAERFDREQSLPAGPPWKRYLRPQVSITIPDSDEPSATESNKPVSSRILNSDIIRPNYPKSSNPVTVMKRPSESTRKSSIVDPVSRDSYLSPYSLLSITTNRTRSSRYHSGEIPGISYEGASPVTDFLRTHPHTILRTSTFGSHKDTAIPLKSSPSDNIVIHRVSGIPLPLSGPPGITSHRDLPGSTGLRTRYGLAPVGPRPCPPVANSLSPGV